MRQHPPRQLVTAGSVRSGRVRVRFLHRFTLALLLGWAANLGAQAAEPVSEQDIKAAYLYKFAAYVTWPDGAFDEPDEPFRIGVLGNESLARLLRDMTAGRKVQQRPVFVQHLSAGESPGGLHILFVTAERTGELPDVIDAARAQSTLVVTDSEGALRLGSVINFRMVGRRVRFEVSLEAAARSGLRLSSQLLSVAEHVERRAG